MSVAASPIAEGSSKDDLRQVVDNRTLEILERRRVAPGIRRRGWLVRRLLMLADALGLLVAMCLAEWVVSRSPDAGPETLALVATLPCWIAVARLYGLYDRDEERADHSTADEFAAVFHMVTVCTWTFWALSRLTHVVDPTAMKLILFWAAAIACVSTARGIARAVARRRITYLQNALIVGAGDVGQLIARKLLQHPEYGINLVGFVDANPRSRRADLAHVALLGDLSELSNIVDVLDVERVIVAFSSDAIEETLATIRCLREFDVRVDLVPRLFEIVGPNFDLHTVEGLPLISLPPSKLSTSSLALKRSLDVLGALAGILVTWPLFLYAAWRIRRESPGPIFFRQRRLGIGMREFTALKFRTMRVDVDQDIHREYIKQTMSASAAPRENGLYKLDRGDAITPFGKWLRKTSLDELPQLINVLRGEMSLVGPRPCIPYETEAFLPHHFERFGVPQGLTGLWQVTARARATFGEALDMDVAYARSWSLRLDLSLLFKTPIQIIRARGKA